MRNQSSDGNGKEFSRSPHFSILSPYLSRFVLLALLCAAVIAACDSVSPTPGAQVPTLPPQAPIDVARTFLDDWMQGDYKGMYSLISPNAQLTGPAVFQELYKQAESTMTVGSNGKSYELLADQSFQQGTTYVVKYNMMFDTGALGKFGDPNRTLRLIQTDRGWRVAWSQMDIFEGMAGGATL